MKLDSPVGFVAFLLIVAVGLLSAPWWEPLLGPILRAPARAVFAYWDWCDRIKRERGWD